MRPFFLAWLTLALLLLVLGSFTASRSDRATAGLRGAPAQEASAGHLAGGNGATMVVKQGSGGE